MKRGTAIRRWTIAGLAFVVLAAVPLVIPGVVDSLKGGTALAAESTGAAASAERTISVSGTGKLVIEPDVAHASFGVSTKGATANEAQTANAEAFAQIEKVLTEQFQVATKDIKTSGFYVRPEYNYPEKGNPTIVGYTADHTLTVTYRDLEGLGKLLDAVSKAGANRMNGVQFGTEKAEAYELQAIEKAMANAKVKADTIAKAAGRSVKGVLHVQQGGVGGGTPPYYPIAVKAESASMDMAAGTSVQPGEMEFTATVSVTYEM